jgi:hypothetical protein
MTVRYCPMIMHPSRISRAKIVASNEEREKVEMRMDGTTT